MANRVLARNPVIALSYSERHKAIKKELLVDYDTGNIYVVSAEDKEKIIDITAKLYEQLEQMSGNNITVEIEGIGTINLVEFLEQIRQEMAGSVKVIDTGKEAHYVGKEMVLDNASMTATNRIMHLQGFNEADTHTIPRKGKDGRLEWIEVIQLPDGSLGGGCGGHGDIIHPGCPDDGIDFKCFIIEPVNDKIYLRASRRQKSLFIDRNCKVILPRTLDEFSEVEWYLVTKSDLDLKLSFGTQVLWNNMNNTQPSPNKHHVYKFKTWDHGETWVGELVVYNREIAPPVEGGVNIEYLEENYYNKNTINATFVDKDDLLSAHYTKKQSDARYYDKPYINTNYSTTAEIDSKYYDKSHINANYYDKTEIDNMDLGGNVDLSNYYNKQEIDNKHYSKDEINTSYYDKPFIDNTYYTKEEIDNMPPTEGGGNVDLSNYYNKQEIDNNHYTKDEINTSYQNKEQIKQVYYDKTEIDDITQWKEEDGSVGFVNKLPKYSR